MVTRWEPPRGLGSGVRDPRREPVPQARPTSRAGMTRTPRLADPPETRRPATCRGCWPITARSIPAAASAKRPATRWPWVLLAWMIGDRVGFPSSPRTLDRAQTRWTVVARAVPAVVLATPVPGTPGPKQANGGSDVRTDAGQGRSAAPCQRSPPDEVPLLPNPRVG
jgi:hypothetical protein